MVSLFLMGSKTQLPKHRALSRRFRQHPARNRCLQQPNTRKRLIGEDFKAGEMIAIYEADRGLIASAYLF